MTIVAVCIYNRFDNLKRWIHCWKQCEDYGKLVIIHNHYGEKELNERFESYCKENQIHYIGRNALGYDIGAFKDVCTGVINLDFETLIWCCDDTLPMAKDFVRQFESGFTECVGCVAMQISSSVSMHVRTTGFAIKKEVAEKLKFGEIKTKTDCYNFEHKGKDTLYNQIERMGLKNIQLTPNEVSPLWDNGYWKRLNRMAEHERVFGKMESEKVLFICPVYEMYPQIISSLICQTVQDWELLLIHNGPMSGKFNYHTEDKRIKFIVHPENTGKWGHELRRWALNEVAADRLGQDAGYIVITNADNYHVPSYIMIMLDAFRRNGTAKAIYCTHMVHNYVSWGIIKCEPKLGYIDCAGVMVKKSVAAEVGWRDTEGHSSDWTYFSDILTRYGHKSFLPVKGCLLIHN